MSLKEGKFYVKTILSCRFSKFRRYYSGVQFCRLLESKPGEWRRASMNFLAECQPSPLVEAIRIYQRWLHLPDPRPALALWATYLANHFSGDPIWLMLIGASSSGKSELLRAMESMPNVYPVDSLTEASLLTGRTDSKDHFVRGGLLSQIGDFGLIQFTDFSNVLSLDRHQKPKIMAALRKLFDGSWHRELGTMGAKASLGKASARFCQEHLQALKGIAERWESWVSDSSISE